MAALDSWLDELDAAHGAPSATATAKAQSWLDSAAAVGSKRKAPSTPRPAPRRAQPAAG